MDALRESCVQIFVYVGIVYDCVWMNTVSVVVFVKFGVV